jgi:hypothetical protein
MSVLWMKSTDASNAGVELYAAIRRVARAGLSGRALERKTALGGAQWSWRWRRPGRNHARSRRRGRRPVPPRPGLTFHGLRHSHKTWLISGGVLLRSPRHGAPDILCPTGSPRSTPTSRPKSNSDSSTTSNAAGTKQTSTSKHTRPRRNLQNAMFRIRLRRKQSTAPHTVSGRGMTITQSSDQHTDQAGESCSRTAP